MKIINHIIEATKSHLKAKQELIPIPNYVDRENILAGKIALISGGSGGIGFAIAKAFVNSGCKVIIAGRNEAKLKEASATLKNAKYAVIDIQNADTINESVIQATTLFEENRIDILVNSAGIHNSCDFWNMEADEFSDIMDINVKGTFFISRAVGKHMIDNKIKGHILNISSASALRPAKGPYQLSKWAIKGLTLGLADILLPYGIIVNAIAPGPTATLMLGKKENEDISFSGTQSGRYATPEEIANWATFMVSDMGNLIVGDTFYITGGSGTISYHH